MMMKRQKWGICLAAAATCAIGLAGEIAERFVYSSCDLCNPERMNRLGELTRKAASCGYTGMVLQGDIPYVFHMGEGPRRELRKYKRLCDELGIEIIPAVWSIGYGAMLYVDPNLAAGLPCGPIVLAVAVMAILITAPLGAILMDLSCRRLLETEKTSPD